MVRTLSMLVCTLFLVGCSVNQPAEPVVTVVTVDEHSHPPVKVVDDGEKSLYLPPAGKYTDADIQANGNVTASQKFDGLKSNHDIKPKVGDKICPITLTKANPQFAWIVDGKSYDFCCPPCVDEFVRMAKETPDEIKEPESYRKESK